MTRRFVLAPTAAICAALAGCIAGHAPVTDAPGEPLPAQTGPASVPGEGNAADRARGAPEPATDPLGPDGCPMDPAAEPEMPTEPADFCLAESRGPDGAVNDRVRRWTTVSGDVAQTTSESTDTAGRLWLRTDERRAGEHLLFESRARLDLPPDGALPDTYGQPATWSIAYTWDQADHLVELVRDVAMDGRNDSAESWRFDARGTVREHRETNDGALYRVSTFDAAGRPLTSLDTEDNGRVWTYGPTGLLTRDAYLTRGEITEYVVWDMAAPERPRSSRRVTVHFTWDGSRVEETVGERQWTYDGPGRALFAEGWHRVEGFVRHGREEYDEAGRVVYSREDTEDGSCHRYEQRTVFADGPPGGPPWVSSVMLDQMTTCDDALFEHIHTDIDAAGRPLRVERVFAGNPLQTSHQLDEYRYDRCGAITRESHYWDDRLTRRVTNRRDGQGRLVERTYETADAVPNTTAFAWDAAGRLTSMGERRFAYDTSGRLTHVEFGAEGGPRRFEGPVVAEVNYIYACETPGP